MKDAGKIASGGELEGCPIPKTHRRLRQAHLLWHQTLEAYHDAERFRANLNSTIEALRNVTFILQSEKAAFASFDAWYGRWVELLKGDPDSKWLQGARTVIVHQGDLESFSVAQLKLITWRDEILSTIEILIEIPAHLILDNPTVLQLLSPSKVAHMEREQGAIEIERRWSTKELNGREILESLATVYGLLANMVLDAHSQLEQLACIPERDEHRDFPFANDRTGLLRCMVESKEKKRERFNCIRQSNHICSTVHGCDGLYP